MAQVVITQLNNQRFLLIYEENELVECHPLQEEQSLQIGNIYIGRVEKVVKNIQSAFVRLDADNVGYLPLNDKPARILNRKLPKGLPSIAEGDTILVQVEQEPQKMKQARVTGNICLSGNYVALDLSGGHVGVSRKIKNPNRIEELKDLIMQEQVRIVNDTDCDMEKSEAQTNEFFSNDYGCVLRTACENAANEAVLDEYRHLCNEMDSLLHRAEFERNKGCIKTGESEYFSLLSDYGMDRIDEIKTDLADVYDELKQSDVVTVQSASNIFVNKPDKLNVDNNMDAMHPLLNFYDDKDYPLYKLLSLETEIKKVLNKKVWLKSGGFLVIEPTEAMVVIDVNTGKSIGKKNKDNHILKLNLEAAEEITKQLRLRNLSGIIMVDFINMKRNEDKQQVIKCLERGLKKDKIPGYFIEITKLDVFEITRKKVRRPLHEVVINSMLNSL